MSAEDKKEKTIFIHELYNRQANGVSFNDVKPGENKNSLLSAHKPKKQLLRSFVKRIKTVSASVLRYTKPTLSKAYQLTRERLERVGWHKTQGKKTKFLEIALVMIVALGISYTAVNYQALGVRLTYWLNGEVEAAELIQVEEKLLAQDTEIHYVPRSERMEAISFPIAPVDDRIIIPRLGINVPVVDSISLDEENVKSDLEDGVVHIANTAYPGEVGNVFLTGHSSYYPWAAGNYKSVFALLDKLNTGDKIALYNKGEKYIYQVTGQRIVSPEDLSVLEQTSDQRKLTLMTCYPLGTNSKRLIIDAHQLDLEKA